MSAFAKSVNQGMLPNHFPDNGEPIGYNNVDGTLWYFIAVYKYLEATGDKEFVLGKLLPVLKDIVEWHFKGTRHGIHATEDGLLFSGEEGLQLVGALAVTASQNIVPIEHVPGDSRVKANRVDEFKAALEGVLLDRGGER